MPAPKPPRHLSITLASVLMGLLALLTPLRVALPLAFGQPVDAVRLALAAAFTIAFVVSAVGLWRVIHWSRPLALATSTLYFVLLAANVVAVWQSMRYDESLAAQGVLMALQVLFGLPLIWWYLCRRQVREAFRPRQ